MTTALPPPAPGADVVESRDERVANFALAVRHMFNGHYRGHHDPLYCGHLRSAAGICTPFQLLDNCAQFVSTALGSALVKVISYVIAHHDIVALDVRDNSQQRLRAHFDLPPLVINNEDF